MTQGQHAVYVYGILAAGAKLEIRSPGVFSGAGPVRRIESGGIAALVSDVPVEPLAAARDLRAHWSVLEEAAEEATVLPVRFGTVMQSDSAVREEVLLPDNERLAALLRELDGKVQLSLKGFYDEERLLREIVRRTPQVARLRERVQRVPQAASYYDRIRLGELVAAEVDRRRTEDAELVLDQLEPLAVAATVQPPATEHGAVDAAFLVERRRIDEFSGAVQRLASDMGDRLTLRYVGPLPPYSFADEEQIAGSGAWG